MIKRATAVILLVAGLVIPLFFSQSTGPCAKVEGRLAEKTAAEGLTEVTMSWSKERIYLHKDTVFSNNDIIAIHTRRYYQIDKWGAGDVDESLAMTLNRGELPGPSRYDVTVIFTEEAAQRLAGISQNHQGRPFAILFDGEVGLTESALTPSDGYNSMDFSYRGVTKEQGERLAQLLDSSCLSTKDDCIVALAIRESEKLNARLEFRLAEYSPTEGLREVAVECRRQKIYLYSEVLISNEDIAIAQAVSSSIAGRFEIALTFTKEGAERLAKATASANGKQLAILLNGKVIVAASFMGPISDKVLLNGFAGTRDAAEKVASALMKK